jgi:hypothetical protein
MLVWIVQLGYKAGQAATPVVPEVPSAKGAGRSRRRKYVLRIDGRIFEAESEDAALAILAQAQSLAQVAARHKADAIVDRALPKAIALGAVKPIQIKAPTIVVSDVLKDAARAAQAAIDKAFADESAAAELRLLLALQDQDDEEEWLLLH